MLQRHSILVVLIKQLRNKSNNKSSFKEHIHNGRVRHVLWKFRTLNGIFRDKKPFHLKDVDGYCKIYTVQETSKQAENPQRVGATTQ